MTDMAVHGGIRHLENKAHNPLICIFVHGGIRHLEKQIDQLVRPVNVHGGIRHLERDSSFTGWHK